ncbi:FAD/NAD(P)-binding domain-containing protein [Schizophyllum commune Tattone D]|nr:FAD/NAD(P)-binding domain-containing protein [Schizophyllum commune Tattone D]
MASNADKIAANDKHVGNGGEVHLDKAMDDLTRSTDLPSTFHLAAAALDRATSDYASIWTLLNPYKLLQYIWHLFYIAIQVAIIALFKPPRPRSKECPKQPFGRIAVIGAGLTGVSSAAHCIAHNFEVTIFEAQSREKGLGGIWAHVNSTSGLQINSIMYRFHPAVLWSRAFPHRDEILGEISRIWHEYNLDSRTKFSTPVTSIKRGPAPANDPTRRTWIVNNDDAVLYDAVIVNVGTCGAPRVPEWAREWTATADEDASSPSQDGDSEKHPGAPRATVLHSSELDSASADVLAGKRVVVVGSGASGVEACETVLDKAGGELEGPVTMLARSDKWIIPRNVAIDTLLAAQPFGREMPLSWVWEEWLRRFHYGKDLEWMVPDDGKGVFEGTPVVNDEFLGHVREGRVEYVRAATQGLEESGKGVLVKKKGASKESEPELVEADVVILATGFNKPSVDFFEEADEIFPEGYQRPDLYLQNFSTEDWSVLMTNSAYMNAIGTVGHFHIGIYTRILLTLLLDPDARPLPKDMKLWVDCVRFVKRGAKGGALGFFTYAELTIWLVLFHIFRPDRLKWIFFIMQGWGVHGPQGSY